MTMSSEQDAIRAKYFHPSGKFFEFQKEGVATAIPARFEKIGRRHPCPISVKNDAEAVTCPEPNKSSNRLAHKIPRHDNREGQNVTIVLQQGFEVIEAIPDVLRSGNYYVTLDLARPPRRRSRA